MNNQVNPTLIGTFIIGAIGLTVAGVLLFGSGKLFRDIAACVMYFEGDVQGLNVGAAVKFRGVKIGEVTSISTRLDRKTLEVRIPVYVDLIDLDENLYGHAAEGESGDPVQVLIERGLRAQLQAESLVTGQQFVQLDFYPDAPPFKGPPVDQASGRREIPTVPTILQKAQTGLKQVLEKLEKLPLEKMLEAFQGALTGADALLNSPELKRVPRELTRALQAVREVTEQTGRELGPLIARADTTLAGIERVAQSLQPLIAASEKTLLDLDALATGDGAVLVRELGAAAGEARLTLAQTRQTLAGVEAFTLPTSASGHDLREPLNELAAAARAIRALAEALEAQPNAVIVGKQAETAP